ncbi:MAG: hypothetical protein PHP61_02825 [Candidatus Izemoplasmatales bacterium]|jgi:uncharacterized protein involved in exopolysaccharide biosynthesis|nr:hypothetical protein [Candidatus Izemoplasmatales bacterium]MDD4987712.1 hypothetical protein [Candidatus Izemoplasmatales bacterium]MDY0373005.1 hypothetical protein [Candidatus Izemoplasmatales bacterium]NLF49454.1 hypothetical protein [Acholeplasmataceae bacterium]
MANNSNKSKTSNTSIQYKAYNPTKSKTGKVIIIILALGMFLGLLVAAIIGMIEVLSS